MSDLRPALTADQVCDLLGLHGADRHRQLHRAVHRGAAPKPLPKAGRRPMWSACVVEQCMRTNGGRLSVTLARTA